MFTWQMSAGGAVGKESACSAENTGDVGSIPEWERSQGLNVGLCFAGKFFTV